MSAKVFIKPRKARPFWFGDPWVFDGSIDRIKGRRDLTHGDVVEVRDHEGKFIGRGLYSAESRIVVRMVTLGEGAFDETEVRRRVAQAIALRERTLHLGQEATAYRLIHAEGDGLPGLVVDRMGDWLVIQTDVEGIRRFRDVILDELEQLVGPKGIWERVSRVAREQEGVTAEEGLARGEMPPDRIRIEENGLGFWTDIRVGQKTGFYTDQRDNRRALAAYSRGRRVLDCFSYTGAIGLTLMKSGQALSLAAVDSSAPALETLAINAEENGVVGVEPVQANVLRFLDKLGRSGDSPYDMIVLDPPKFVPKKADLRRGLKLYHELNVKALRCLPDGGLLATCSCSQAVTLDIFLEMLSDAAHATGRVLQLLFVGRQGADHPTWLPHEESSYLKMCVLRVLDR